MVAVAAFVGGMFSFGGTVAVLGSTAVAGAWAGAGFASTILGSIAVKLLTTVAVSALTGALTPDPPQAGGITISATVRGEHQPETIILGKYATAGQAICPPYSHGKSNRYLTHVIELCSAPGAQLERVMLGDDWVELSAEVDDDGFHTVLGEYDGLVWIKYYDGTQTAADPMLLDRYGSHPDRPWTTDMVGAGICYAILTFKFDQEDQSSVPRYRFELSGIPLYDPRKDGSAGGVGPHRLNDPSTWEPTSNAALIAWNIMRGIPLPGGEVWGGNITDLSELPWTVWTTAMNRCDAPITLGSGGTEPAYRAGLEVALDQPPAAALEEIFKACSATVADLGYGWGIVVGAPALPVYAFTDDDVIVSRQQELDPFPGIEDTYNAVTARYPDPEALYETKEAPRRTNATWEAADAFGRRMSNLALPAVPYKRQVQRLTRAWIEDARRFRRHVVCLPPDAAHVELIDTVDWSSTRNGYAGKDFSVHEITEDPRTGIRQLSIRERDPNDYSWVPGYELPSVPTIPGTTPPAPESVSGFDAAPALLVDANGTARRAAIGLTWANDILAEGLRWEIRLAGQAQAALRGTTQDIGAGATTVSEGVLPETLYEARARLIAGRRTVWTDWVLLTTDSVRIGRADIEEGILEDIDDLLGWMDSTGQLLDDLQAQIDADGARIDSLVGGVRDDLADEVASIRADLTAGLASTGGYTETAIEDYDVIIQGQIAAMAGQIEQLTAALTSDNLIANGKFADASGWTLTNSAHLVRAGSSDALILACPEEGMVGIGVGTTGEITRPLNGFEVGEYDRIQMRFWAASTAASRPVALTFVWRDGNGDPIGAPTTHTMTISGANTWKSYSAQVDPPDNAVGGDLTIAKTTGGTRMLVTDIDVTTVNIAIEARVTSLEAARVTESEALAVYKDEIAAKFDDADAALSEEASTRADEVGAVAQDLSELTATVGGHTATIGTHATALANADTAITQLNERLASQFGGRQLVRDPYFDSDLAFWANGVLGDATRLVARARGSANAWLADMPGTKAFQLLHTDIGARTTLWIDVSTAERYDLGAFYFRAAATSPQPRAYVQWGNEAGQQVGAVAAVNGTEAPGAWRYMGLTGLAPPTGATKVRVCFQRNAGSAGLAWITGLTLTRQAASEFLTSAEIETVKRTAADTDDALSQFKITMTSRVGDLETGAGSMADQIDNRYTKAQTDSAISAAITQTTATLTDRINQRATTSALNALTSRVDTTEGGISAMSDSIQQVSVVTNEASAYGRLRVSAHGSGADAGARIGLSVRASLTEPAAAAGLFLEAKTDGTSRVSIIADQFAIVSGPAADPLARTVPFYIRNGSVYMRSAVIDEASIGTLHLANGAVVGGYTTTLAGSNQSWNNHAEIGRFTVNLPEAYRGILFYECTDIQSYDGSAMCAVGVQLNGLAIPNSGSSVSARMPGRDQDTVKAGGLRLVNLTSGNNVLRLWGVNTRAVSYKLDLLAFKR